MSSFQLLLIACRRWTFTPMPSCRKQAIAGRSCGTCESLAQLGIHCWTACTLQLCPSSGQAVNLLFCCDLALLQSHNFLEADLRVCGTFCRHWATWLQLPLVLALFSALLSWFGEPLPAFPCP